MQDSINTTAPHTVGKSKLIILVLLMILIPILDNADAHFPETLSALTPEEI